MLVRRAVHHLYRPWVLVGLIAVVLGLSLLPWFALSGSVTVPRRVTGWTGTTWRWSVLLALTGAGLGLAATSPRTGRLRTAAAVAAPLAGLAAVLTWLQEWWAIRVLRTDYGWTVYTPFIGSPTFHAGVTNWAWAALAVYVVLTAVLVVRLFRPRPVG